MSETMSVQWFPGHMAKTRRIMASNLKLVDIVVELCDARIPQSSRNPEIDKIVGKKPRLMLLNKADCADAAATEQWLTYYRKKGIPAMACDCRSGRGVKNLLPAVRELLAPGGQAVCLIKPQFEAGKDKVGKKGVVRDPAVHLEVLEHFLEHAKESDFTVLGLTFSPIRGPEGNIELSLIHI